MSGKCAAYRKTPKGPEEWFKFGVNDIFGEFSLLKGTSHPYTVKAVSDEVEIQIIYGYLLDILFGEHPDLASRFYKFTFRETYTKLENELVKTHEILTTKDGAKTSAESSISIQLGLRGSDSLKTLKFNQQNYLSNYLEESQVKKEAVDLSSSKNETVPTHDFSFFVKNFSNQSSLKKDDRYTTMLERNLEEIEKQKDVHSPEKDSQIDLGSTNDSFNIQSEQIESFQPLSIQNVDTNEDSSKFLSVLQVSALELEQEGKEIVLEEEGQEGEEEEEEEEDEEEEEEEDEEED